MNHVNTVVRVAWPEEPLSLVHLGEHHVTTKLQEEGLLKVAEDPFFTTHRYIQSYSEELKKRKQHSTSRGEIASKYS